MSLSSDVKEILYSEQVIADRVKELGAQIANNMDENGLGEVVLIGILKGAVVFLTDLARSIDRNVSLEMMSFSSYGSSTSSSGEVKIELDLRRSIEGKHIIIVEDILDTGLTMSYILGLLEKRNPASIQVAVLFQKPVQEIPIDVNYVGFMLEGNPFIIGYGLDFDEKYRALPYVGILKDELIPQ
eukprot:TRINITY_DN11671_c0_g1_i1.p1 TRINITY_DN11671_c0_g1~~TRINITY_DN11671_c0_g1_i1.p1  ORF type:complete len:185 (+),score=52.14 TRINITY_DN11671_c0_g1_i1:132-686(+)